jgi:SAM-dependent methyltransferase
MGDMRAPDEDPAVLEVLRDATSRQMEYVERYVPVGRALNVGAMSGATAVLSERGWKLHFVEVSRYAAESARARWGYDVTVTRLEDFQPAMEPFDFVKLGHVIEHIGNPRQALHSVVRALRPGGVMLLDTDNAKGLRTEVEGAIRGALGERNARALVRRVTGKNLEGRYGRLIPPVHVHIFSMASLRRLLDEAGFEIIKMRSPAWGNPTWFPLANLRTLSLAERAFVHLDQFGALLGRGELLSVLARKR